MSVNKVIILGNIGNIETRYTPSGEPVVNMSVATSEKWKDKNSGQMQEATEWHRVVIFGAVAKVASEYCQKGDKIYIEGKVKTRKWQDKEGKDQYTTEIVLSGFDSKLELLGSKTQQQNNQQQYNPAQQPQQNQINQDYDDDFLW